MQSEIVIGTLGHVDHGKTSIIKAITGQWVDTHSEELKRGITIKIGFTEATFYKCEKCNLYTTKQTCEKCGAKTKEQRRVSLLDAPGHEMLMTTAIAASSIMDGVILIIAANEKCPQPQTEEHLMVLDILGIKNIVVVQNKVDLVSKEQAKKNYEQIKEFLKGSIAENAPIVPVAANYGLNIDKLIETIEKTIPTPKRNIKEDPKMYIARSFDINKPGTEIKKLKGGVIGGSLITGKINVGDEIEILPGIVKQTKNGTETVAIKTKIIGIMAGKTKLKSAIAGGLVALETELDPSLAKNDGLVGSIVGKPGKLPKIVKEITIKYQQFDRNIELPPVKKGDIFALNIGTATNVGIVKAINKNKISLILKRPLCLDLDAKMAVSRKIGNRIRLSGFAEII